eukprot:CAMPEP_0115158530 /NCGR_PEP_ID=MMETSP0227-20121206/69651_1 /TAXON_ID=89957 /ORGANISM="Polarella glacialis, Strain CCMP 1383" /LENGTH=30 /DNA_ID= /DNA_START= /DNA_END= /DNA_ORIENTATION=
MPLPRQNGLPGPTVDDMAPSADSTTTATTT